METIILKFTAYFISGWVICGVFIKMRCDLPVSKERKFVDELMRYIGLNDEEIADVVYNNDPESVSTAEKLKYEYSWCNRVHEFTSKDGLSCSWWWLPYA